ncbi:MAG: DUF5916 domain-containing protein [Candidatus Aminicenantales bacterium]
MKKKAPWLILASFLLLSAAAAAQDPAENYVISPAASKIKVDGLLDEDAWQKATVIKLPYEWMPGDNAPAPVETECLVTFDRSGFYIAFRCFDPKPEEIRAHLMDRDATDTLIQDDHINVIIDAFNDERRGFQFRVNPLGVQADANFSEMEGYEDFSWDAIWASAGKINDWGYAIEIAIPFNQLRFPRTAERQTWGFSAERSWPRSVRHRMESHPRDRNRACLLCQFNKLSGFEGISPGRNLEFDPTLTASRTDAMDMAGFPSGGLEQGPVQAEPGITAKWGLTPNLILNATANPDFSQVEADVAQLDVNKRFALYYPEKRPFFLEGGDFFLTPIQAVFTRTVADPLWGTKLTGKSGRSALGFFAAQDRINNLIFPSNQGSASTSLDQDVTGGVFRYRHDVGKGSTLGLLYTGRAGSGYANHVAGADGFFRLSQSTSIRFQYLHSETEYPGAVALDFGQNQGVFGGDALQTEFMHMTRNWQAFASYSDINSGFRADYGFMPRVDVRTFDGELHRLFWGNGKSWFTRLEFWLRGYYTADHDGRMTDSRLALGGSYHGPLQSTVAAIGRLNREYYNGVTYDVSDLVCALTFKPAGGMSFGFESNLAKAIDYNNYRPAEALRLGPWMELGLGTHINLNVYHSLERLESSDLRTYTANLSQVRLIYNFNVRSFVRAIMQYRDVNRVPERYIFPVDPHSKGVFTQFLFSYKINPQTVLFLGYSDNSLGLQGIDITRTDHTFFFKIGYALVL